MSNKEIDRLSLIQQIQKKQILQVDAARQLGLSVRQTRRLLIRYRTDGASGLVSKHKGRRANNAITDSIRIAAIEIVRDRYPDFSPTFAHEKLTENHHFKFSVETLRKWMIDGELWFERRRKPMQVHQRRPRRPCFGELIQIDGSPHDWFEGRSNRCTLIVFIDDATSIITAMQFAPTETTQAYMETLESHLESYGRPVALYSDKHSIFRVNKPDCEGELTQFTRAIRTLDIEPIHANTPQAKGRVERANLTLQDRLVKEMRLRNISDIETANKYLPTFIEDYNRRFSVMPTSSEDAHREVLHSADVVKQIMSIHHTRKLSKNLCFQFQNKKYQIQGKGQGYRMRGGAVRVCVGFDGSVVVYYKGEQLKYRVLITGEPPIKLQDEKSVLSEIDTIKASQAKRETYKPAPDHPWKKEPLKVKQHII